jgi:predicted permease
MDELAFHREMIERDQLARGVSPAAAREGARRAMGNETFMREEARGVWLAPRLESVLQDARYALRGLRRNPGFTAGVVMTLALGIGANAAMFSLVDRLLFRPPPFLADPASVNRVYLFKMFGTTEGETGGQYARYTDLVKRTTAFSQIAAFVERTLAVGVGDAARELPIGIVSAEFFEFFNGPPLIGRYFNKTEDTAPNGVPVAVLSYAMWQTEYGGRRDVLGATVQIGAAVYTIIGVAPAGFVGLWSIRPPAAFIPVTAYGASLRRRDWATTYTMAFGLTAIVRRNPGVTVDAATADLTHAFLESYQSQRAADSRVAPASVVRARALAGPVLIERGPSRTSVGKIATWVGGVTVIVLIIACANVANLLLARALSRRREIAVRVSLGVSRARLLSQLLTESMLLAALGGVAGVLVAQWGGSALRAAFLPGSARVSIVSDFRTLLFAGAAVIGVGVFTGFVPMLQVGRVNLAHDLKAGARDGTYQRSSVRAALLTIQIALSLVLLVGAALFVRSLRNVQGVRLGFDADPVLMVGLNLRGAPLDSARLTALRLRLLERATSLPGVEHASLRESIPFQGESSYGLYVEGVDSVKSLGDFDMNSVSPDYFATMGTRILRGRGIEATDRDGAPPVMVIGQSMGAVLWPGTDPIGKCVRIGADTAPCTRVVGIAENIHSRALSSDEGMHFYYLPAAQWNPQEGGLFVRVKGDAGRFVETLRHTLQREMPRASYVTVTRFSDVIGARTRSWSLGASLFTAFGMLALILAAVGLYSVIAYSVAQRSHELGVRMALGAGASDVLRLVVAEGARFAIAGAAIGIGIALASGKWIGPLLFNQSPSDPAVFAVVVSMLLSVAIVASLVPAFRAAHVDPRAALQAD